MTKWIQGHKRRHHKSMTITEIPAIFTFKLGFHGEQNVTQVDRRPVLYVYDCHVGEVGEIQVVYIIFAAFDLVL